MAAYLTQILCCLHLLFVRGAHKQQMRILAAPSVAEIRLGSYGKIYEPPAVPILLSEPV
jgi:hypothetical protein